MAFERISTREIWRGRIAALRVDRFRYDDGGEADREIVEHPGVVAIVPHDGHRLYLVAQPREAVGEQALLEVPAGKLEPGEDVLTTAKRELAEEIGKAARTWERLTTYYSSPGFTQEEIHVLLASDLYDERRLAEEEERIEMVEVPLERLDEAIERCRDGKSLVGLLWLRAFRSG
jgi:8-oxo-dGTP pyrophosphatase MutT (NUDIX family)